MNRKELQAAIKEKSQELAELQAELDESYGRILAECRDNNYGLGCGKKTQIHNLTHIQTRWYVPPSGCTDGAYWLDSETQWDCPHCNHRNRSYITEQPEITEKKQYFGKHVISHDENGRPPKVDPQ